jgi:uncharacterized protein (TIGR03086 family)
MSDELPIFPATAPAVFSDAAATKALLGPVLDRLTAVVDFGDEVAERPTPCAAYDAAQLRDHALAWLQFFAAALTDPEGSAERLDPTTWTVAGDARSPSAIVNAAKADIAAAVDSGVAGRLVTMSEARMPGDAVLGMALGEYIIHGWDLGRATGAAWSADDDACDASREFLVGMVAPEYRGADSGFFGDEVVVDASASALHRLLGFAGRDPGWNPPTD